MNMDCLTIKLNVVSLKFIVRFFYLYLRKSTIIGVLITIFYVDKYMLNNNFYEYEYSNFIFFLFLLTSFIKNFFFF